MKHLIPVVAEISPRGTKPLLKIDGLSVSFGRTGYRQQVVRNVTFSINRGEKLALVGESGSGKSVTALSILRLHDSTQSEYSGQIYFEGKALHELPESDLRRIRGRDIAMVFQEPMTSLNPTYTVGHQLIEPLLLHESISKSTAFERAVSLLERVGISEPVARMDAFPHMLSGGQRQRVMIAMALACRPRLLIADEPTTALDVTIQKQILELLDELQQEFDLAVLLITHDLNMVRAFADRVCVMKDGELVETSSVEQLFTQPKHPYSRSLLASQPEPLVDDDDIELQEILLEAEPLQCHFPIKSGIWRRTVSIVKAVDQVELNLRMGETLGIVGESGSGKSTLGLCLLRLQPCKGDIRFQGVNLTERNNRQMRPIRRSLQVVFQDPFSSLSPRMSVAQIIDEGLRLHYPKLSHSERHQRICNIMREVGLDESMLGRYPHEFSGGQRQRIAIARVVVLEPSLILLDEPTSALDVSVQKQVLVLLRNLQIKHRMSYIFISHDLKVIRSIAHRVMVMEQGRVVEEGETAKIFVQPNHPYTRSLLDAALLN